MVNQGADGNVIIGTYAEATSRDPEKHNIHLALSMQHHNEGAANAAQMHGLTGAIIEQFDDSDFKDLARAVHGALWAGYYASNSHQGRFLRDFLVNEHRVIDNSARDPQGSILEKLGFGKKKSQQQQQ